MNKLDNINDHQFFLSSEILGLEFHEAFTEVSYLEMLMVFSSLKAFVNLDYITGN